MGGEGAVGTLQQVTATGNTTDKNIRINAAAGVGYTVYNSENTILMRIWNEDGFTGRIEVYNDGGGYAALSSNGLEMIEDGASIRMKSPNGTIYTVTVNDAGEVIATPQV